MEVFIITSNNNDWSLHCGCLHHQVRNEWGGSLILQGWESTRDPGSAHRHGATARVRTDTEERTATCQPCPPLEKFADPIQDSWILVGFRHHRPTADPREHSHPVALATYWPLPPQALLPSHAHWHLGQCIRPLLHPDGGHSREGSITIEHRQVWLRSFGAKQ